MRNFFPEEAKAVDSISDLKDLQPIPTRTVVVESFQLSTEGIGGGLFWWDESGDASLADDDTMVSSNISGFQDGDDNEGVWRRVTSRSTADLTFEGSNDISIEFNDSKFTYTFDTSLDGTTGDFQYNQNGSLKSVDTRVDARFEEDDEAFTFGSRTGTVGYGSIVLSGTQGSSNEASGAYSFAFGRNNSSKSPLSFSLGENNNSLAESSNSIGVSNINRVFGSTTIGLFNEDYKGSSSENIEDFVDSERIFSVGVGDDPNSTPNNLSFYDGKGRTDGLFVTYRDGTYVRHGLKVQDLNSSTGNYETVVNIDSSGSVILERLNESSDTSQIVVRDPTSKKLKYTTSSNIFEKNDFIKGGRNINTTFNDSSGSYNIDFNIESSQRSIKFLGTDFSSDDKVYRFNESDVRGLRVEFDQLNFFNRYDFRWGFNVGESFKTYIDSGSVLAYSFSVGENITTESTNNLDDTIRAFNSTAFGTDIDIAGSDDTHVIGRNINSVQSTDTFIFGNNVTAQQRENVVIGYSNEIGQNPGRRSIEIGWGLNLGVNEFRSDSDPQIALGFYNEEFSSERVVFNYGSGVDNNNRFTSLFIERNASQNTSYLHSGNIYVDLNSLLVDTGFGEMEGSILGRNISQTNYSSTLSDNILWGNISFSTRINLNDNIIFGVNSSESSSTSNKLDTSKSILAQSIISGLSDSFQPTLEKSFIFDSDLDETNFSKFSVDSNTDRIESFVYNNDTIVGFSGSSDREGSVILTGGSVNGSSSLSINGAQVSSDNSVGIGNINVNQENVVGIGDPIRISKPVESFDRSQILVRNVNSGHIEYLDGKNILPDISGGRNVKVLYNSSTDTYNISVPDGDLKNRNSGKTEVLVQDPSNNGFYSANIFASDDNTIKVGSALQFDSQSITIGARDSSQGNGNRTISIGSFVSDSNSSYNGNIVTGNGSIAIGTSNVITGFNDTNFSYSLGINNKITTDHSVSIGGTEVNKNEINSSDSFIFGQGNTIGDSEPECIQIGFGHDATQFDFKQHVLIGKNLISGQDNGTSYQVSLGKYNEGLDESLFSIGTGSSGNRKTSFYVTETNGTFIRDGFEIEHLSGGSYDTTVRFNTTIQQADINNSEVLVRNNQTGDVEYLTIGQIEDQGIDINGKLNIDVEFVDSLGEYQISTVPDPEFSQVTYTSGGLNTKNDNRIREYSLNQITYDNTKKQLKIDSQGKSNLPTLNDFSTWHFEGRVVSRVDFADDSLTSATNGDSHMWKIEGAITNTDGENPRFIGQPEITTISTDNEIFDYNIDVDVTNSGEFIIYVTGENGATVNWTSSLRVVEVIA